MSGWSHPPRCCTSRASCFPWLSALPYLPANYQLIPSDLPTRSPSPLEEIPQIVSQFVKVLPVLIKNESTPLAEIQEFTTVSVLFYTPFKNLTHSPWVITGLSIAHLTTPCSLLYPQLLTQPPALITIFPAATEATQLPWFSGSTALLCPDLLLTRFSASSRCGCPSWAHQLFLLNLSMTLNL